jgi:hypothetical protein
MSAQSRTLGGSHVSHHSGDQFASAASPRCRRNICRRKGIPVSAIRPKRARSGKSNQFGEAFSSGLVFLEHELGPLADRCRVSSPGSKFISLLPPADSNDAHEIRPFYWGIDGFVELSETWRTELPQTIRAVLGGQYWARPQILAALVKHA